MCGAMPFSSTSQFSIGAFAGFNLGELTGQLKPSELAK
jgi:hypothetical protein